MSYIIDQHGSTIHQSRNLRAILEYACKHVPTHASLTFNFMAARDRSEQPYRVCIFFDNGAFGYSYFADWRVFAEWIKSRRSWKASAGPSFEVRYSGIQGVESPQYPYA
jgi:hypothetical protein